MTAEQILDLLENTWHRVRVDAKSPDWIFVRELRTGTGFGRDADGRIDAYALNTVPSEKFRRVAYEVKVSRADFRRDVAKTLKHRPARLHANEFYYVAPEGVIPHVEVPIWAGLMEVRKPEWSDTEIIVKPIVAPWHDTSPPSWSFVSALLRRVKMEVDVERNLETGV